MVNLDALVSVNMCTIRPVPRWRQMLDSLEKQTFRDFEYVICDALYDERKDEVEKLFKDYSFPIVYVKDKPWFHSDEEKFGTRPGLSSARNTGVMYSQGRLIVWHDDNSWLPPDWLSRHVKVFEAGFDGMAGMSHGTYSSEALQEYRERYDEVGHLNWVPKQQEDKRCGPCQVANKPCPHIEKKGERTFIKDYREDYSGNVILVPDFDSGKNVEYNILPVGWLYGTNMSIRTEYILKINGFPEEFCGQMGSEDSFTTVCLQRAGAKLLLDKNCYVIHVSDEHHKGMNTIFDFTNNELLLMDGKMHFSNEKFVQNLLFKEKARFRNNPQFNLREMRTQKLEELY